MEDTAPLLFSIGHSSLAAEAFLARLQSFRIEALADIRTMPRSRYNPHFNADALARTLEDAGIAYLSMRALGGRRRPRPDSRNGALGEGFRGYADYMQTPQFAEALAALVEQGKKRRLAFMCAEADPAHCHRLLVSDALAARGVAVAHITGIGAAHPHRLHAAARIENGMPVYAPAQGRLL